MGFLTKFLAAGVQATVGVTLGLGKDIVTGFGMMTDEGPESFKQAKGAFDKATESVEDLSKGKVL